MYEFDSETWIGRQERQDSNQAFYTQAFYINDIMTYPYENK